MESPVTVPENKALRNSRFFTRLGSFIYPMSRKQRRFVKAFSRTRYISTPLAHKIVSITLTARSNFLIDQVLNPRFFQAFSPAC